MDMDSSRKNSNRYEFLRSGDFIRIASSKTTFLSVVRPDNVVLQSAPKHFEESSLWEIRSVYGMKAQEIRYGDEVNIVHSYTQQYLPATNGRNGVKLVEDCIVSRCRLMPPQTLIHGFGEYISRSDAHVRIQGVGGRGPENAIESYLQMKEEKKGLSPSVHFGSMGTEKFDLHCIWKFQIIKKVLYDDKFVYPGDVISLSFKGTKTSEILTAAPLKLEKNQPCWPIERSKERGQTNESKGNDELRLSFAEETSTFSIRGMFQVDSMCHERYLAKPIECTPEYSFHLLIKQTGKYLLIVDEEHIYATEDRNKASSFRCIYKEKISSLQYGAKCYISVKCKDKVECKDKMECKDKWYRMTMKEDGSISLYSEEKGFHWRHLFSIEKVPLKQRGFYSACYMVAEAQRLLRADEMSFDCKELTDMILPYCSTVTVDPQKHTEIIGRRGEPKKNRQEMAYQSGLIQEIICLLQRARAIIQKSPKKKMLEEFMMAALSLVRIVSWKNAKIKNKILDISVKKGDFLEYLWKWLYVERTPEREDCYTSKSIAYHLLKVIKYAYKDNKKRLLEIEEKKGALKWVSRTKKLFESNFEEVWSSAPTFLSVFVEWNSKPIEKNQDIMFQTFLLSDSKLVKQGYSRLSPRIILPKNKDGKDNDILIKIGKPKGEKSYDQNTTASHKKIIAKMTSIDIDGKNKSSSLTDDLPLKAWIKPASDGKIPPSNLGAIRYFAGCLWFVKTVCVGNAKNRQKMQESLSLRELKGLYDFIEKASHCYIEEMLFLKRSVVEMVHVLYVLEADSLHQAVTTVSNNGKHPREDVLDYIVTKVEQPVYDLVDNVLNQRDTLLYFEGHWKAVSRMFELSLVEDVMRHVSNRCVFDILRFLNFPKIIQQFYCVAQVLGDFSEFSAKCTNEWAALDKILRNIIFRIQKLLDENNKNNEELRIFIAISLAVQNFEKHLLRVLNLCFQNEDISSEELSTKKPKLTVEIEEIKSCIKNLLRCFFFYLGIPKASGIRQGESQENAGNLNSLEFLNVMMSVLRYATPESDSVEPSAWQFAVANCVVEILLIVCRSQPSFSNLFLKNHILHIFCACSRLRRFRSSEYSGELFVALLNYTRSSNYGMMFEILRNNELFNLNVLFEAIETAKDIGIEDLVKRVENDDIKEKKKKIDYSTSTHKESIGDDPGEIKSLGSPLHSVMSDNTDSCTHLPLLPIEEKRRVEKPSTDRMKSVNDRLKKWNDYVDEAIKKLREGVTDNFVVESEEDRETLRSRKGCYDSLAILMKSDFALELITGKGNGVKKFYDEADIQNDRDSRERLWKQIEQYFPKVDLNLKVANVFTEEIWEARLNSLMSPYQPALALRNLLLWKSPEFVRNLKARIWSFQLEMIDLETTYNSEPKPPEVTRSKELKSADGWSIYEIIEFFANLTGGQHSSAEKAIQSRVSVKTITKILDDASKIEKREELHYMLQRAFVRLLQNGFLNVAILKDVDFGGKFIRELCRWEWDLFNKEAPVDSNVDSKHIHCEEEYARIENTCRGDYLKTLLIYRKHYQLGRESTQRDSTSVPQNQQKKKRPSFKRTRRGEEVEETLQNAFSKVRYFENMLQEKGTDLVSDELMLNIRSFVEEELKAYGALGEMSPESNKSESGLYCLGYVESEGKIYCKECTLSHLKPHVTVIPSSTFEIQSLIARNISLAWSLPKSGVTFTETKKERLINSLARPSSVHRSYLNSPENMNAKQHYDEKEKRIERFQSLITLRDVFASIRNIIEKGNSRVSTMLYHSVIGIFTSTARLTLERDISTILSRSRSTHIDTSKAVVQLILAREFQFVQLSINLIVTSFDVYGEKEREGTMTSRGLRMANFILNTGDGLIQQEFLRILKEDRENKVFAVIDDILKDFKRNLQYQDEQSFGDIEYDEVHIVELSLGYLFRLCMGGNDNHGRDFIREQPLKRTYNLISEAIWLVSELQSNVTKLILELKHNSKNTFTLVQLLRNGLRVLSEVCYGPNETNQCLIGTSEQFFNSCFSILYMMTRFYTSKRFEEEKDELLLVRMQDLESHALRAILSSIDGESKKVLQFQADRLNTSPGENGSYVESPIGVLENLLDYHTSAYLKKLGECSGDKTEILKDSHTTLLLKVWEYCTRMFESPVGHTLKNVGSLLNKISKTWERKEHPYEMLPHQVFKQVELSLTNGKLGGKLVRVFFPRPFFFGDSEITSKKILRSTLEDVSATVHEHQKKKLKEILIRGHLIYKVAEFHYRLIRRYGARVAHFLKFLKDHFFILWMLTYSTVVVINASLISWAEAPDGGSLRFEFRIRGTECRLGPDGTSILEGSKSECEQFTVVFPLLSSLHLLFMSLMITSYTISDGVSDFYEEAFKQSISFTKQSLCGQIIAAVRVLSRMHMVYYYVLYILCAVFAIFFTPMWNALHLVDIAKMAPSFREIIQVAHTHMTRVGATVALGLMIVYGFTIVVFVFLRDSVIFDTSSVYDCQTLWTCVENFAYHGFISTPIFSKDPLEIITPTFSMMYFLLINTIMVAIITGIIIETFTEMRHNREEAERSLNSQCFVCQKSAQAFDELKTHPGFQHHIHDEHNISNYVYYKYHILYKAEKDPIAMTNTELASSKPILDGNFHKIFPCKETLHLSVTTHMVHGDTLSV